MAWAEKLPSGRWRGVYRDAQGGRRTVEGGPFTHKVRAVRAASAAEEKARRRMHGDPDAHKRTWGDWVEEWWPTRDIEASTRRVDLRRRELHLDPHWSQVPVGAITRQRVKAWIAQLRADGVGPTTVQRCAHLLSASLSAALDAEIIDANPAARLKLAGSAKAMERYFDDDETIAVWEQMPTQLDRLIFDTYVGTGVRPGEGAGLHWNRLDLRRAVVRVVETYDQEDGTIKAYPKGRKVRDVPLPPDLVEALDAWKVAREAAGEDLTVGCGLVHSAGKCRSALVLTSPSGTPLRVGNWDTRVFKPALEAAGVGHARVYDLRHTYASRLLQQGVSLAEVGQLLGHVSPQTTQIYAHLAKKPSAVVLAAISAPRLPHDKRV